MIVAVIGAGNVGGTLGRAMAAAGHSIRYGLRDPGKAADALRHDRGWWGLPADAVAGADAVLLATPWAATEAAISSIDFGGRPLLDATNPIGPGMRLTHGHTDSGGEQVQRWAPSARVVKVFNTTGRENMEAPAYPTGATLMLACGDDAQAVDVAVSLAQDIGFEALAFGPLSNARLLEPMGRAWIELAIVRGQGRNIAFGLLRR